MSRALNIALFLGWDQTHYRDVREGIYTFARPHRPWGFATRGAWDPRSVVGERYRRFDGGIGVMPMESAKAWREKIRKPLVLLGGEWVKGCGSVEVDLGSAGRMAAEHLLGKGFEHLAYYRRVDRREEPEFLQAYVGCAKEAGVEVDQFDALKRYRGEKLRKGVALDFDLQVYRWLSSLAWPVGVYCADDRSALQAAEICRRTGLEVPERVAVLGAGDDDMKCRLAYPQVSNLRLHGQKIGYEAARMLEMLVNGERREEVLRVKVEPGGVEGRQSTDVVATGDREVSAAVRFIREHAHEGIGVADILREVPVNRRDLERRFQRVMKCSPYTMILRVKLEQVRKLLSHTDRTVLDVAEACGFSDAARMTLAFNKAFGLSPGRYRKKYRLR